MSSLAVSSTIAVASLASLIAQALFGLLMLHLFAPADVGAFTVVAQLSFFWMTLALAQSPLSFLANSHLDPGRVLQQCLKSSATRWLFLAPVAAGFLWFAKVPSYWLFLAWSSCMALLQMGWYMAQPWTLRTGTVRSAAMVRALPPIAAVLMAGAAGLWWNGSGAMGLLLAATLSFGIGSLWLFRASGGAASPQPPVAPGAHAGEPAIARQRDDRSVGLRLAHTVADAIAGTAVVLIWQRAYGLAEASYVAVLLRLLGLFPAMVYAAWPQVLLSRGQLRKNLSAWVGLAGAAGTAVAGLVAAWALQTEWLAPSWQHLAGYIAPLVLWQCSACLFAAHGHLPFQGGTARQFSWATIAFNTVQLCVLVLPLALTSIHAEQHVWWLAGSSACGLLALTLWMRAKT